MSSEMKNLLITIPFVLVMLFLLIWLIRALIPTRGDVIRQQTQDKFDQAGYESMQSIQRKEYSIIALSVFAILLVVAVVGGLGYMMFSSGISGIASDQEGMNVIMMYVPAIIFLILIIAGSTTYVKRQQHTMHEYKAFQTRRARAIEEYQAKRSGKGGQEKQEKKEVKKPTRQAPQKSESELARARKQWKKPG